jgi:hypothetical protein
MKSSGRTVKKQEKGQQVGLNRRGLAIGFGLWETVCDEETNADDS